MNDEQKLYLETGNKIAIAVESQMFGKPCFKINGKAFMSFFDDCLICKLNGEIHAEALSLDGAKLFDPSGKGRAMKEWVQIPFQHKSKWQKFANAAAEYISQSK